MFHNIQALLDMLQRSYNSPILILHLSNLRWDQQSIQIGSPIQAIYYMNKTQIFLILLIFYIETCSII